jgi:hypothetical protein
VADENIRSALRGMPVPEPRAGFEDRLLAAVTHRKPASRGILWWAAGAGALAATLAWVALMWVKSAGPVEPTLVLSLNESRNVPLVIDSERELDGATIRIIVTGSVALDGYDQQREVEWQTTLTPGANLLSLPVIARQPGDGRIVAEIEHQGKTRRVSVTLHVVAPARTSSVPAEAARRGDIA